MCTLGTSVQHGKCSFLKALETPLLSSLVGQVSPDRKVVVKAGGRPVGCPTRLGPFYTSVKMVHVSLESAFTEALRKDGILQYLLSFFPFGTHRDLSESWFSI